MKRLALILIVVAATFAACEKKESTPPATPIVVPPAPDTSYALSGLRNLEMFDIGMVSLPIDLVSVTGQQSRVALSVSGLPEKAKAVFEPAMGIVPYSTTLKIYADLAVAGEYVLTITSIAENGTSIDHKIKLRVNKNTKNDCTISFLQKIDTTAGKISVSTLGTAALVHDSVRMHYDSLFENTVVDNLPLMRSAAGNFTAIGGVAAVRAECNNKRLTLSGTLRGQDQAGNIQIFNISGEGTYDEINKVWQITYIPSLYVNPGYVNTGIYVIKGTFK